MGLVITTSPLLKLYTLSSSTSPINLGEAGTNGYCYLIATNSFTDIVNPTGKGLARINDNGNDLGLVRVNTIDFGSTKLYNDKYYLQRGFEITVENAPTSKVTVQLLFSEEELRALIREDAKGTLICSI